MEKQKLYIANMGNASYAKAIKAKCPPTAKNYETYFTTAPKSPTFTEAAA